MINRSIGNDSPDILEKVSKIDILKIHVKPDECKGIFPVKFVFTKYICIYLCKDVFVSWINTIQNS